MKRAKIKELGTIINGGTPSTTIEEYWRGNVSWITPDDLSKHNGKWISYGVRSITEEGIEESSAKKVPKNSILISSRAPVGYVARNRIETSTNQGMKSFVPDISKVDPDYMYYFLKKNTDLLNMRSSGTTFQELSKYSLENIELLLPSLDEQRRIGKMISLFDNKIDLNDQFIKDIEEYSYLIFHKWFVDYNFPYENKKEYKNNGGKMNEIKLPEGWDKRPISDFIETVTNGDWGEDNTFEGAIETYCIRGADISNIKYGKVNGTPTRYIKKSGNNIKTLKKGNIVVEASGGSPTQSTGRTVLIRDELLKNLDKPLYFSNFSKVIVPKEKYSIFLYFLLNHLLEKDVFFHFEGKTSGIKNLLLDSLVRNISFVNPKEEILIKFDELAGLLWDKIIFLGHENELLEETRDLFIHKLIK